MSDPALLARLDASGRIRRALHPLRTPPTGPAWNLAELDDLLLPGDPQFDAAVLVGLVPRPDATQVILTRRTDALRHHGGQVAFPGGRVEPFDADAVAAALRETDEEIGVPPAQVTPLGLLDPLLTVTGFRVIPVVAVIDPAHRIHADPGEVADVFEVPLEFLLDPANLVGQRVNYRGRTRQVWEYRYPAQRIWGVTASILMNLRQRLEHVS